MSGYWRVCCPYGCRTPRTRIPTKGAAPDVAEAMAVRAEYDAHMQQRHGEGR